MSGVLFAESARAFKRILAAQMGCEAVDYESHNLAVVQRPADSREPYLALMTTCGTGSVVSVRDPRLADWVREQTLETHFRIFLPSFLEGLAATARDLGHANAKSHSASGGMVIAEVVDAPRIAPGHAIRELTIGEQTSLRASGKFDNGLGAVTEALRIAATRIAFGVCDADGRVVAVSGVWDQYPGVDEIGLDVLREHRGKGLASALTVHATRWIRSHGRWPIYTYGFTNVRSMNNALACGFRPLWFIASVNVPSGMD